MNRRLLCVILIVILGHLLGIAWIEWFSSPFCFISKCEKLTVKTVELSPEVKKKEVKEISVKPKKAPLKTIKKTSPPVKKKVVEKKSKPSFKRQSTQKKLLAQARQNLHNIAKDSSTIDETAEIHSMQIDSIESAAQDQGYYLKLAACLRQSLRLPDIGDVKIYLSLDCKGSVVQVNIVYSENENNRRYVEKVLPTVAFPPFGRSLSDEKKHTFTITLTNDS